MMGWSDIYGCPKCSITSDTKNQRCFRCGSIIVKTNFHDLVLLEKVNGVMEK